MRRKLKEYIVTVSYTVIESLRKIDANKQGFVIVVNDDNQVIGVLTDGDVRRAFIRGRKGEDCILDIYSRNPKKVLITDGFDTVVQLFKDQAIKFLPIVDQYDCLVNVITKNQLHTLLLQDIDADLSYDFSTLETSVLDHEIFPRPWGFYKTTVLNDYYQGKIISVKPRGQLSLQSHNRREEHWIVIHGNGTVQLDESLINVRCGSSVFIPKGCKHRLMNTDSRENLIIAEVQIGDYLGEDDIVRYEDLYGRSCNTEVSVKIGE